MFLVLFEKYELITISLSSLILFLSNFLIIKYWNEFSSYLKLKKYNNVQKVHHYNTPRLGGFIIYIVYFGFLLFFYQNKSFFFNIVVSFTPMFYVAIKEDLFIQTNPNLRIIMMILSSLIFFNIEQIIFPEINFPILNKIHSNIFILLSFFIFSSLVIINGFNLVDGMNGLLGFTMIVQLLGIIIISHQIGDVVLVEISILILLPILIFLIFNYPFGRIFIGDLGAYLFGFIISMLVIKLFGDNKDLLSWNAVLILFYPSFELLFSFIRKIFFEKKHPLKADDLHLHTIIYKFGLTKKINSKLMNNLVVILLIPFWFTPLIVIKIYNNLTLIILVILFLSILYIFSYIFLRKYLTSKKILI